MTKLLSVICSAAVMLAVSSNVFAQTDTKMKNDSSNKPQEECMPCKPVCKPCCFFEQGMALQDDVKPPCDVKYNPAYNAAAAVKVGCSWDFNVDASFIYWDVLQDAMDLTMIRPTITPSVTGSVVRQDTGYKPGFKIGIGWDTNFDNWTTNAEYTWLHFSKSTDASTSTATTSAQSGFLANDWFTSGDPVGVALGTYARATSEWKMHMDMVDVVVGRPFYQGTHVTVSPTGGLRGLWLRQSLDLNLTESAAPPQSNLNSDNSSHSWAVGPVAGVNTHMMFWNGLRFDGVVGASLLYTRYTSIRNTDTFTATLVSESGSFSAVRPTVNMGLGLGYGMYAYSNKFFFDLAVRYDFSQFWSQNVMHNFVSQLQGFDSVIGDLMMHGLTVTLRCDF